VLALAFDHLGAVAAVSSAEVGNAPSLAVSRRLGYADNGLSRTNSPNGVIELQHVRLLAETWRAAGHQVQIDGAEACLPWFGLDAEVS
jgi:RimJ/RimL family protein N-acetyltransferase